MATANKVKVLRENSIGVPVGIYDQVACPKEYEGKFDDNVWINHPKRNEPVRMLTTGRLVEAEVLPSKEDILMGMKSAGASLKDIQEELVANGYEPTV